MSRFIKTPILDRLARALRRELDSLTLDELKKLNREIERTTDFNCEASSRMIAVHYSSHVSAVIRNRTTFYIKDSEQLTYRAFWEELSRDLTDPNTGGKLEMGQMRKALFSGRTVSAGHCKNDMHTYKIVCEA